MFALDPEMPAAGWPEIDVSILEEKRGAVPGFPLDLLPQSWRDWARDTASSAAAPADYVAQTVLAGLAGLCGAGVAVRITPLWSEPLVLWHMAVGAPSTGKSRAFAPMHRLLRSIEGDAPVVVAGAANEIAADIARGNPRGVLLWRDEPSAWLGDSTMISATGCKRGPPAPSRSSRNTPRHRCS